MSEAYSLDIPHVTAIELPLIVHNAEKAISMIGGQEKISRAINASEKINVNSSSNESENVLELRLRTDPFHHPILALKNFNEKVLLKVSIPKKNLPADYYKSPSKYTIRSLIKRNEEPEAASYKIQPIGIINKTFLFKGIADFQVSTKHNRVVQEFKELVLNVHNYDTLKSFFEKHNDFSGISDFKNEDNYKNQDHLLLPPPIFSPIHFPFDYKYQMNPLTAVVRDSNSGEVKVITKKNSQKLHTRIIDFYNNNIPMEPAPELCQNLEKLHSSTPAVNSSEHLLLECIRWLRDIFEVKPIWLRKHLEDIVPQDLKRVLKQSLPYVSYIYKSGPWRFCNVKFGVNPKEDVRFWIFQSEYFRIPGLHFSQKATKSSGKIVPKTITNSSKGNKLMEISEYLIFTGSKLPLTVTYQIGDIFDQDISSVIETSKRELREGFFRHTPDFQDGWVNRQTMETIRRLIRYKLNRMVKEEPIENDKIQKIITTDYTESQVDDMEIDQTDDQKDASSEDHEEEAAEDEELEENDPLLEIDNVQQLQDDILSRLDSFEASHLSKLKDLIGFIEQDSLK